MRHLLLIALALGVLAPALAQEATLTPSTPLFSFTTAYDTPTQIVYSSDGALIAVASVEFAEDGLLQAGIEVFNAADGALLGTLAQEGQQFIGLAAHPSVPQFVTTSLSGQVTVWDATTRAPLQTAKGHDALALPEYNADGTRFITYDNLSVIVWSAADNSPQFIISNPDPLNSYILAATISPDGNTLALSYQPHKLVLYDANTGAELRQVTTGYDTEPFSLAFTPDGSQLWLLYGTLEQWDIVSSTRLARYITAGAVIGLARRAQEPALAIVETLNETAGRLALWDTTTQQATALIHAGDGVVWDAAFRPDGAQLAVARGVATLEVYATP